MQISWIQSYNDHGPTFMNCSFNVFLLLWPLCTSFVFIKDLHVNGKSHLLDNPKHPTVTHMYRNPPYSLITLWYYRLVPITVSTTWHTHGSMSDRLWDMSEGGRQSVDRCHVWLIVQICGRNKWVIDTQYRGGNGGIKWHRTSLYMERLKRSFRPVLLSPLLMAGPVLCIINCFLLGCFFSINMFYVLNYS